MFRVAQLKTELLGRKKIVRRAPRKSVDSNNIFGPHMAES
jgi:hypothetical protein